jgi:hypothetical protein
MIVTQAVPEEDATGAAWGISRTCSRLTGMLDDW